MSGIGLDSVYVTPELKAAQDYNAAGQAAGSPPAGIGLSTSKPMPAPAPAAAPPAAKPDMPTLDTSAQPPAAPAAAPAPAKEEPLLDFEKNPLFAIGMLMSSFSAGVQGRPNPLDAYKAQKAAEQANAYKTASLALDAVDKVAAFASKLPADQREAAVNDLNDRFAPALGGFQLKTMVAPIVEGKIKDGQAKIAALREMGIAPNVLASMSPEAMDKIASAYLEEKAKKAANPEDTLDQIKAKAKAKAAGEREGNPPREPKPEKQTRRFALVNGQSMFLTDDEILAHQSAGHKVEPVSDQPKPMNSEQANAATFADRAAQAEAVLGTPKSEAAATSPTGALLSHVPGGNFMQSPQYQAVDQAQRNFVNAILRRESGAAISPDEFDNARKQYFPQPGDKPEVIKQKRQNRATAIKGLSRAAGPQYQGSGGSKDDPLGLR